MCLQRSFVGANAHSQFTRGQQGDAQAPCLMEVGLIECNQMRARSRYCRIEHVSVTWIPNMRWPPKVNLVGFRMLQEGRNHNAGLLRLDAQRAGLADQHRFVFQYERHGYVERKCAIEHLI